MSIHCCGNESEEKNREISKQYKSVLWIALVLNFSMFILENIHGLLSHSLSLRADAIDFLGDSANYFMTLFVLSSKIQTRAKVSLLKALFMLSFGVWVLVEAFFSFYGEVIPTSLTMTWVGTLALVINGIVATLLYRFRDGDSNMQSVWLCSRNDAIGNLAVIIASAGVYYFSSKWPDLIVAILMSALSVNASLHVFRVVKNELS